MVVASSVHAEWKARGPQSTHIKKFMLYCIGSHSYHIKESDISLTSSLRHKSLSSPALYIVSFLASLNFETISLVDRRDSSS